jgi:hypothetical protein
MSQADDKTQTPQSGAGGDSAPFSDDLDMRDQPGRAPHRSSHPTGPTGAVEAVDGIMPRPTGPTGLQQ